MSYCLKTRAQLNGEENDEGLLPCIYYSAIIFVFLITNTDHTHSFPAPYQRLSESYVFHAITYVLNSHTVLD